VPTKLTPDALVVDRTWSPQELAAHQAAIAAAAGPSGYYHGYVIRDQAGQTLTTPGPHPTMKALPLLDGCGFPKDLTGKRVLDIGCNAGFYSFVARLRGASSVLGLDYFPHCVEQAKLFRDILQLDVEFGQADGENLVPQDYGTFDFVIDCGVLYHLHNPMKFLGNMAQLTSGVMFLETEMLLDPKRSEDAWFIEGEYGHDGSTWWIPGPECTARMARASGFSRAEFQGFAWKPTWGYHKTPEGLPRQGRGVVMCWK